MLKTSDSSRQKTIDAQKLEILLIYKEIIIMMIMLLINYYAKIYENISETQIRTIIRNIINIIIIKETIDAETFNTLK